ncbi:MAG: hypothetical protein U0556_09750 [Dehalococcoidia bacterium]
MIGPALRLVPVLPDGAALLGVRDGIVYLGETRVGPAGGYAGDTLWWYYPPGDERVTRDFPGRESAVAGQVRRWKRQEEDAAMEGPRMMPA